MECRATTWIDFKTPEWVTECNRTRTFTTFWLNQLVKRKIGTHTLLLGALSKEDAQRRTATLQTKETWIQYQRWAKENSQGALRLTKEYKSRSNNLRLCWRNIKWIKKRKRTRELPTRRRPRKTLHAMKRSRPSSKSDLRKKCWLNKDLKCSSEMLNRSDYAKKYINWLQIWKRTNCWMRRKCIKKLNKLKRVKRKPWSTQSRIIIKTK